MSAHLSRTLTDEVVSVLEAAGLTVGRSAKPATVPAGAGWVIVYPVTGGTFDGDIYDPYVEVEAAYQLSSMAITADQCELVSDTARAAMLAGPWSIPGRGVIQVEPVFLGGVQRDDDVQPPVFYSPDRYTIWTGSA